MADVFVTALAAFAYRGRAIRAGERVAMRPIDAAAAAQRRDVTLDRGRNQAPRALERRDLEVERPAPSLSDAPTSGTSDAPPRRRAYRRRDQLAGGPDVAD